MAQAEHAIKAILGAHAGLKALVGIKVYPSIAPQSETLPFVTFHRVTTVPIHLMGADSTLEHPTMQVTSWASTYAGARDISVQVCTALRDYTGAAGGVTVQRIFFESEIDLGYDMESKAFGVAQQYEVWYR